MAESSAPLQDLNAIDALTHVFNLGLSQKPQTALGSAGYYIYYIKYFPTNFEKILKAVKENIPKFSGSRLRLGRRQLLIDGVVAQILPMVDYEKPSFKKKFGRELLLPIDPGMLWEAYKNRLDRVYINKLEPMSDLDGYFDNLSEIYKEKFCLESLDDMLTSCLAEESLSLNYSANWFLYNLLGNVKYDSTVKMMMGGARAFDSIHRGYYESIFKKGASIDVLLGRRDQRQLKHIGHLIESYGKNLRVKYTPIENCGTHRIAILDKIFALDAKKMQLRDRLEPSYLGMLYLDKDYIIDIENYFDDIWATGHEISPKETKDTMPSWWDRTKFKYPWPTPSGQ